MLTIPSECPKTVTHELQKAFTLYWVDPSSALARIRCAIERLCDDAGVPSSHWVLPKNATKKELRRLSLHQRIQMLPARHQKVGSHLLALKWLGNDGAHTDGPDAQQDLLDAMKVLDEVLSVLFDPSREDASAIAKAVNKKKGSRHRKRS